MQSSRLHASNKAICKLWKHSVKVAEKNPTIIKCMSEVVASLGLQLHFLMQPQHCPALFNNKTGLKLLELFPETISICNSVICNKIIKLLTCELDKGDIHGGVVFQQLVILRLLFHNCLNEEIKIQKKQKTRLKY